MMTQKIKSSVLTSFVRCMDPSLPLLVAIDNLYTTYNTDVITDHWVPGEESPGRSGDQDGLPELPRTVHLPQDPKILVIGNHNVYGVSWLSIFRSLGVDKDTSFTGLLIVNVLCHIPRVLCGTDTLSVTHPASAWGYYERC